jgi:CRP/FNR family cyclic AMP-dependent transcriptional regulator
MTALAGPRANSGLVLDLDPDLGSGIGEDEWEAARQMCRANLVRVAVGGWDLSASAAADRDDILGLILVEGVLAREVALADHRSLELLCPGDVLLLPASASRSPLLSGGIHLTALRETTLMVLGRAFLRAAATWPSLLAEVHRRLEAQTERLALQGLAMHLARAEHRILLTLWLLADSCGRVTPDGTVLPLEFTHDVLSQMTAARRPTVSLALRELQSSGYLHRRNGHLLLTAAAEREVMAITRPSNATAIGTRIMLHRLRAV